MTDQELADAIRERGIVSVDSGKYLTGPGYAKLLDLLRQFPPVTPDPPCTIDKVPGWSVHTDANGHRFAHYAGGGSHTMCGTVLREEHQPDGIYHDSNKPHPWPAPPRFQPGDLVDVYPAPAHIAGSGINWSHQGRICVGIMPDGRVITALPSASNPVAWPPDRVRPHVEGTV